MGKEKAMGKGMDPDKGKAAFFLSSFAVGIMNPAAVLLRKTGFMIRW